jgi:hypothetical protein
VGYVGSAIASHRRGKHTILEQLLKEMFCIVRTNGKLDTIDHIHSKTVTTCSLVREGATK